MSSVHARLGHQRGLRAAAVVVAGALAVLGTVGAADVGAVDVTGDPMLRPSVGQELTHTLSVSGDPLPTDVTFDPALPAGLAGTITGDVLTIAGVPTGPAGPAPTTVTVSNGLTTASLDLDLAVTAAPAISAPPTLAFPVGTAITPVEVAATGWPTPTVAVEPLPPGLTATPTATGVRIEGTPSSAGAWTAAATATNVAGSDAAAIEILVGVAPTVTAPTSHLVDAGAGIDVPITATGSPAPALEAAGLPVGVALVDLGSGSWALRGPTSRAVLGAHTVVLTARNAFGEASAALTLTVQGPPQVAPLPTIRLAVGAPADAAWVATGYPTPDLAVTSGSLPAGLTAVDDGTGRLQLTGTPTTPGYWWVTVQAQSPLGAQEDWTTIEVGHAPRFAQERLELRLVLNPWGSWIDLGLNTEAWSTLTVAEGSLPPGMRLGSGSLEGRPSSSGHYEATVTATNEFGSDSLVLVVDVGEAPDVAGDTWEDMTFVADAGSEVTGTFTTVGVPVPSVTPIDPLPPGLTLTQDPLDPSTWHLAGPVTRADRGRHTTRFVLSNGFGPDVTRSLYVEVLAPLQWETPQWRTVVTPRGEPITPVRLHLTGYPLRFGLGYPSGKGLTLDIDWGTGDVYADIVGTPVSDLTFEVCPWEGLVQKTPCHSTLFVLRDRPVVHVTPEVTVHVGDVAGIPVTVTSTHAVTLAAAGLPAGLALVASGPGAWTITGTAAPAAIGRHTVTLTADNGVTGTATLLLDVTGPPSFDGPVAAALVVGETPTTVVRASGLPVPAVSVVGDLPDGVTAADDGAGSLRLEGTPTRAGTWTVTILAANGYGTATTTLSLTVDQAPAFDQESATLTVREGQTVSWAPSIIGTPAPAVALVAGSLPPGISLAPDGTLHGAPTVGAADAGSGSYAVTLRATNAHGADELPVTISVLSVPSFAGGLPTATITADDPATITIRTAGWDRPAVGATGSLPPGLVLAQVDDTTWTLTGTVERADRGGYDVPLVLTNAFGAPVTGTLHVDVTAAHQWSGPTTVEAETGVGFEAVEVVLTGYPISDVSIAGAGSVTAQSLDLGPTRAAYRITGHLDNPGDHPVTFTSDTGAEHTVRFVVRDRPVIHAPATATVVSGTPTTIPVTVEGLPTAGLTATHLPPGLSLTPLDGGGWAITGTPERAFGPHDAVLAADNGIVTTRALTLTVEGPPALPEAPPVGVAVALGSEVELVLPVEGSPAPTVGLVGGADVGLSLVPPAPGTLRVAGTTTTAGPHHLVITATNAHGTAELAWDLVVTQPPAFAVASSDLLLVEGVAGALPLPLAGYPHPTVGLTGEVPGVALVHVPGTDPALVGTPTAGSAGTYDLTVTARTTIGGVERVAETVVHVRVDAAPRFVTGLEPLAAAVGATVERAVVVTAAPSAEVTADGLPEGLALRRAADDTWLVEGTPLAGSGGVHEVRLTAGNGVLGPVTAVLRIAVAEPTEVNVAVGPLREGLPASIPVTTTGGWPAPARLSVEGALPAGLRLVDAGDGTGHLAGTPAVGTAGVWPVTVTADNGSGVTRYEVTLTIAAAPAAPPVWRDDPGGDPDGAGPGGTGPDAAGPDAAGPDAAGPDGTGPDGTGPDGTDAGEDPRPPDPTGTDDDAQAGPHGPGATRETDLGWWLLLAALGLALGGAAWWRVAGRRRG